MMSHRIEWNTQDKTTNSLNVLGIFMSTIDSDYLLHESPNNQLRIMKKAVEIYETLTQTSESVFERLVKNQLKHDSLDFYSTDSYDIGREYMTSKDFPFLLISSTCIGREKYNKDKLSRTINDIISGGYKGSIIAINACPVERGNLKRELRGKIELIDAEPYFKLKLQEAILAQARQYKKSA